MGIPSRLAASSYFNSSVAISVAGAGAGPRALGQGRHDFPYFHMPVLGRLAPCISAAAASASALTAVSSLRRRSPLIWTLCRMRNSGIPAGRRRAGRCPPRDRTRQAFLHQILRFVGVAGQRYRVAAEADDMGRAISCLAFRAGASRWA